MTQFDFKLRELYTDGAPESEWPQLQAPNKAGTCIDMKTRVIDVSALAKEVHQSVLKLETNGTFPQRAYRDYVPNSAELGLELNDPAYYFSIYPPKTSTNTTPRSRRLWTKAVRDGITVTVDTEVDIPSFSQPIGPPAPSPLPPDQGSNIEPIRPVPVDTPTRPPRTVSKDLPTRPVDSGKPPSGSTPSPCFVLKVVPDYKVPQPPMDLKDNAFAQNDYVPTKNDYLLDLVFTVRKALNRTKGNNQLLREIVINIPHATNNVVNAKTDALLKPDWNGGVKMLSNQRFMPFIARAKTFTQIRLVPRSADEHPVMRMDDLRTSEISFRLTDVDVPESVVKSWVQVKGEAKKTELGFVRVDMYERYQVSAQGVYSIWNQGTFVIKRDIKDEGR